MVLTDEQKAQVVSECYHDPVMAAKLFAPHWFPGPGKKGAENPEVAPLHRGILAILLRRCNFLMEYGDLEWIEEHFVYHDGDGTTHKIFNLTGPDAPSMEVGQFTLLMLPRGFAKTTCNNFAMLFNILFEEVEFSVYISETGSHAEGQITNIRDEIATNPKIREIFGELKPAMKEEQKWTDTFFETRRGYALRGRGSGSQIRGLLHRGRRPKRINLDDLETKETVQTVEQRQKKKEWYYGDVEPALDELDEDHSVTATGTLLHEDALLANLMLDPRWTVIKFGAIDVEGEPIWHRKGHEWYEAKKAAFVRAGLLHIFYLEYQNEIRAPENADFCGPFNVIARPIGDMIVRAICIDPAISENMAADFCGLGVTGMTDKGIIHVFECFLERGMSPREQVDKYFDLAKAYEPNKDMHGVEAISYQKALIHLLREEMFRKKYYFDPKPITHTDRSREERGKNARIRGILQPRYASGYVSHQKHMPVYEGQLLDFPRGKKDGPDVIAMCVSLMDPAAGLAGGDDITADAYPPLDEVFDGDWRQY